MQRASSRQETRLTAPPVFSPSPAVRFAPPLHRRPTPQPAPLRFLSSCCAASADDDAVEHSDLAPPVLNSYPVQLRVYNIDRWGLAPVGGRLLRKEVDGIYHVAVAVHGKEYWFDHQVEQLNLSDVFFVRGFSPAFLYDMGTTSMKSDETEAFCFGPLREKYNIDTYDVFYHNCHHFARDLCLRLTSRGIPQWLIDHGEKGLSELSEENAKLVRVVSNKIARIMMVSWGRYSKRRFVEKQKLSQGAKGLSALDPIPLAGESSFFADAQPRGVTNKGLRQVLPERLLHLGNEGRKQDA